MATRPPWGQKTRTRGRRRQGTGPGSAAQAPSARHAGGHQLGAKTPQTFCACLTRAATKGGGGGHPAARAYRAHPGAGRGLPDTSARTPSVRPGGGVGEGTPHPAVRATCTRAGEIEATPNRQRTTIVRRQGGGDRGDPPKQQRANLTHRMQEKEGRGEGVTKRAKWGHPPSNVHSLRTAYIRGRGGGPPPQPRGRRVGTPRSAAYTPRARHAEEGVGGTPYQKGQGGEPPNQERAPFV